MYIQCLLCQQNLCKVLRGVKTPSFQKKKSPHKIPNLGNEIESLENQKYTSYLVNTLFISSVKIISVSQGVVIQFVKVVWAQLGHLSKFEENVICHLSDLVDILVMNIKL